MKSMRSRIRRIAGFGVSILLLGAVLAGCGDDAGDEAEDADEIELADDETTTTTAAPTDTTAAPTETTTAGGGGGGGGSGGGTTTTQAPGPAPIIVSFNTPENIDCHNSDFQQFTASWTTTNAVEVTISIDGPGIYDTYPPNGETDLPFNCSTSHTYLLTAIGQGGSSTTRSITLQPRNAQVPSEDDAD